MNPLTLVKRIQNINSKEASLGISEDASWHAGYKDSAYVYVGGIPFDLTEGDLLAVFAQYGEIVDVNLVRDKGTGKSKGFAFIAYEDQRSTILAVDNLNGAQILGRTVRVDHVSKYKKKEEEDEEALQQKREERGVCRAFQRGECTRGDGCKFSHNEQRAANTGWGAEDQKKSQRVDGDKFDGSARMEKKADQLGRAPHSAGQDARRLTDKDVREPSVQVNERGTESRRKRTESDSRDRDDRGIEKRVERQKRERIHKDNQEWQEREKNQRDSSERRDREMNHKDSRDRHSLESNLRESGYAREGKRSRNRESESHHSEGMKNREREKRESHDRDSSPHHRYRGRDEDRPHRSRR